MAVSKRIKEVIIGGSGTNNPFNYSWSSYVNYPDLDTTKTYQRISVIVNHDTLNVALHVTGLVEVVNGTSLMGPNDLVYCPCPPFCQ